MGDIIYEKRTTQYTTNLDKLKLLLIKLKKNKVITSKIIINVYYGFHTLINGITKKNTKLLNETYLKLVIKVFTFSKMLLYYFPGSFIYIYMHISPLLYLPTRFSTSIFIVTFTMPLIF